MIPPLHIGQRHGLTAGLRADIHTRIGSIPGCGLLWVDTTPASLGFSLSMRGWSPSLHRTDMDVAFTADAGTGQESALAKLDLMLGLQRRRAAAGLALGTPFPLDHRVGLPMSQGEDVRMPEVRHLWVDRSAISTLIARHPNRNVDDVILGAVIKPLERLHEAGTDGAWHQMGGNGIAFTDENGLPEVEPTVAVTRDVVANGEELILTGRTIPETACALLTGEPLERLVDLGPDYSGRIIACVKPFQTHVVVDLVPDLVRIDQVLAVYRKEVAQVA